MKQHGHKICLTPNSHFLKKTHKSPQRIPNPILISNKLKINFPFLSARNDTKNKKNSQERSWTQRGIKCKTEEIQRKVPRKVLGNKEKDSSWQIVVDGKISGGLGERMNQFLNENPQGKLSRFEDQGNQKQSEKIKRQLHNLEQIQTKLFSKIQTVNHKEGHQTQMKHLNHARIISNDFLPSLKTNDQIKKRKKTEKTISSFDGMVTFSPVGGKGWNGREVFKSQDQK